MIEMPRQIPLISVWKNEEIRIRLEIEKDRGYGRGNVLERIPINDLKQEEECSYQQRSTMMVRNTNYILFRVDNMACMFDFIVQ